MSRPAGPWTKAIALIVLGFLIAATIEAARDHLRAEVGEPIAASREAPELESLAALGAGASAGAGIRFHEVDGVQTFSPAPGARVACWWVNKRQFESASETGLGASNQPLIPTRSAGLSCVQLDADGWGEYTERFPTR